MVHSIGLEASELSAPARKSCSVSVCQRVPSCREDSLCRTRSLLMHTGEQHSTQQCRLGAAEKALCFRVCWSSCSLAFQAFLDTPWASSADFALYLVGVFSSQHFPMSCQHGECGTCGEMLKMGGSPENFSPRSITVIPSPQLPVAPTAFVLMLDSALC